MKRLFLQLLTIIILPAAAGCGGAATVEGKAAVTEPAKTQKSHSPPPVRPTETK
jgi:hypothetical protein